VQKFKGHYKQMASLKKSGCTDNDARLNAYAIWKEDEGTDFGLEHAWWLLKDQPNWLEQFTENCSKRTMISAFGAYSSSFNPETTFENCPSNGEKGSQKEEQGERSRNIYQSCWSDWCEGSNEGKKCCQHQTSSLKGERIGKWVLRHSNEGHFYNVWNSTQRP